MDKRYHQLKEGLNTHDPGKKISIIKDLRDQTPFNGAILLLCEYLDGENDADVDAEILDFLNDLNDQSLTGEVVEAIDKAKSDIAMQKIISSCWQSGLNYSSHLESFIRYSIKRSYLVALECYSVIEEWIHEATEEQCKTWKSTLQSSLTNQPEDKKKLVEAIISLL